jgi:TonB family protein
MAQNALQNAAPSDSNERLYHSFQMGVLAIQDRHWDDAVTSLNEAVRLDPTRAAAWARLGEAYFGMARSERGPGSSAALQKSLEAYSKAVEKDSDDAAYHNGYALALAASGHFDDLMPEVEKAAALDPLKAAQYYYTFGVMLLNSEHPDAAVGALKKAAEAAPGISEIYFQYGCALTSQTRVTADGKAMLPEQALDAFHKYLEIAPGGPQASIVRDALAFHGSAVVTSFGDPIPASQETKSAPNAGAHVTPGKPISNPQPAYPLLARRLRVAGPVSMKALVGKDGTVRSLVVESGNPMLFAAALNAVKQWTYKPTIVNDKPVEVNTRINVNFTLGR